MNKLTDTLQQKLMDLPETGMGYQIVNAYRRNARAEECVVLNSEVIEPINRRPLSLVLEHMFSEGVERMMKSATITDIVDVELVTDLKDFSESSDVLRKSATDAQHATITYGYSGEEFIRFSAFYDDKRVDKTLKKLLPGSYATTQSNALYCMSNNIDPVSYYALPCHKVAYAFNIRLSIPTKYKKGTVLPNHGQKGGGVEVLFVYGTSNNTVTGPTKL